MADFRIHHINEDEQQTIVVIEVKCFADPQNDVPDIYKAIGQYPLYRTSMRAANQPYPLYLAIPSDAYERFSEEPEVMEALQETDVKLIVVDLIEEKVITWINW